MSRKHNSDVHQDIKDQLPNEDTIIEYLEHSGGHVKRGTMAKYFNLKGAQRRGLRFLLKDMEAAGKVELNEGNFVDLPKKMPKELMLDITSQDPDDMSLLAKPVDRKHQKPDLTIHVESKKDIAVGDRIEARLTHMEGNTYMAHPIRVIAADVNKPILGSFTNMGEGQPGQVVPLDTNHVPRRYVVQAGSAKDIPDGAVVKAQPTESGASSGVPMVEILEVVGDDMKGLESLVAIHNFDIPYEFPQDVLDHAESLPAKLTDKEVAEREDLRKLPLVTIDGPDAKDFDDAVFVERNDDGGFHAIVAIADVAKYIREGEELDKEGYKRGNSTYFPDRVVPMLPERISNDLCSLRPHEDRPVLAVHMTISPQGKLIKHKFVRAVIHSHARLTYGQVADAIEGNFDDVTKDLWPKNLEAAYDCFKALLKARKKRNALDLDIPETAIVLGPDGSIERVEKRERNEAHQLIEELMVVANVAAAEALESKKAPCIYRVHPEPTVEKLEALNTILKDHNLSLSKISSIRPEHMTDLITQIKGRPEEEELMQSVLRSQQQAVYTPENKGHFGLALKHYAHFTSPIRRYSDLVVHRSLIDAFGLPGGGALQTPKSKFEDIAEHICVTERRSQKAEWDAKDRLVARYYEGKVGDVYDATVLSVHTFGMFVVIEDGLGEGLVPMRLMGDDYYRFDEKKNLIVGSKTGVVFKVGTESKVTLSGADVTSAQLTFALGEVDIKDLPSRNSKGGKGGNRGGGNPKGGRGRNKGSDKPNGKAGKSKASAGKAKDSKSKDSKAKTRRTSKGPKRHTKK